MDDEPFIEGDSHRDQPMTRVTDPTVFSSNAGSPLAGVPVADDRSTANSIREGLAGKQVCPFCGTLNPAPVNSNTNSTGPCPRCTMEDSAATRQATKARIGPWHVLQTRNPAAPGMRYATLLALVGKGQVTARSIVRGPTTHQLWRYAAHVKGLSREFGVCYSCGESVDKTAVNCPHCDRSQEPVGNPDALLEAREPVVPTVSPAASFGLADASSAESYPMVARQHAEQPAGQFTGQLTGQLTGLSSSGQSVGQALPQPMMSHAERLRNGIDGRADFRRRPEGRALSAMELAAALQVAPPPPAPEGHPARTVLITLLVVAILAALIIGYARPDLRRNAQSWLTTTTESVEQTIKDFHLQKRPPADQVTPQSITDDTVAKAPAADVPPATPTNVDVPAPAPTDATVAATAHESPNETPNETPSPTPLPSVQVTVGQSPAAQSAPAATPTYNANPSSASAQPSQQSASSVPQSSILPDRPVLVGPAPTASEIRALRLRGMDAESRQDWAQAVKCYEQIEAAPKDMWPGDVKIRLENAQRELGK